MQINSGKLNVKRVDLDSFKNLPPRPILCAECKSQIGSWDRKLIINKIIYCRKYRIYNLYRIDTGETEITKKPVRITGTGVTFY